MVTWFSSEVCYLKYLVADVNANVKYFAILSIIGFYFYTRCTDETRSSSGPRIGILQSVDENPLYRS